MGIELIRELYGYHRWANRRLFDVANGLGACIGGIKALGWTERPLSALRDGWQSGVVIGAPPCTARTTGPSRNS